MNFLYLQLMGASSFLKAKALIEKPGSPIALHDSCLAQSRVGVPFKKFHPKNHIQKKNTSTNTHNFFNSCNTYQLNLTFTQCGTRPPQSDRSHRAYGTRERECWTPTSQCTTCHGKNSQLTTVGFRRLVYFKEACFFGLKSVKYIVSHVNVYNISSIYGVFTLLGLPEQKSANL